MEETNYISTEQPPQTGYVDLKELFRAIGRRRKVFYWVLPITFVLSSALILCVPKYYVCEVVLAPESSASGQAGSLQALASSFGFNMQNLTSADALYPTIYPDIAKSPDFLVKLFDIPVTTAEGEYSGTYYNYLAKEHKRFFLKRWTSKLKKMITPAEPEVKVSGNGKKDGVDVFCMSKKQWYVLDLMQKNISCKVDRKTEVITFRVKAQDKLVCAIVADSACTALQHFITDYRTKKARVDFDYYKEVMARSYQEYQEACEQYIRYADSHSNLNLKRFRIEADNLETEMKIKQAAYTSFQKQYLATQARLQENTPVYTLIQSASVPVLAAGPKKTIFVLAMLFLATCVTCFVLGKEQLMAPFK